jgi:hypothetical protein
MAAIGQTFACPQCGKRFTWKPQYAGRKVSCGCGRVFEASLGFEGATMHGDAYDVAADPPPVVVPSAVTKASAPSVTKPLSSVASAYPQRKRRAPAAVETEDEANLDPEAANPLLHVYIPWALLIVGAGAQLGQSVYIAKGSVGLAIVLVILALNLTAAVTLAGAFLSASILGVSFGSLSRASVKLAGIAVFCSAASALIASIDKDPHSVRGLVLGMHASLLIYMVLIYMMFDLDVLEALTTVVIIWICQWILAVATYSVMSHLA